MDLSPVASQYIVLWAHISHGLGFVNCSVGILIESCTEVEVENCVVTGSRYDAVKVTESANVTVKGCTFADGEVGVELEKSGGNRVQYSGFEALGQGVILDESNHNYLEGNSSTVAPTPW